MRDSLGLLSRERRERVFLGLTKLAETFGHVKNEILAINPYGLVAFKKRRLAVIAQVGDYCRPYLAVSICPSLDHRSDTASGGV